MVGSSGGGNAVEDGNSCSSKRLCVLWSVWSSMAESLGGSAGDGNVGSGVGNGGTAVLKFASLEGLVADGVVDEQIG